jgi:hypothetical protein
VPEKSSVEAPLCRKPLQKTRRSLVGTFVRCIGFAFRGGALERGIRPRCMEAAMIRKLKTGYRLYSRKINPKTGRRRNLGTFKTRTAAEKHERAVQYFKRH